MLITDRSLLEKFDSRHRVWQGIPGIARTKKGRTFISFYSGETSETYGNYAVLLKSDTDTDFGEPIVVVKKEGKFRCFDPVLWIDPLERLWFFWNVMPGEEVYASICEKPDADEIIWGEEFYVGRGIMMNKPTVLSSGEWLFPIAIWKTDIFPNFRKGGLKADEKAGSYVYKSSDNGKTFVCMGMADIRNRSFDEHMVLELRSGVLKMYVRTNYGIGVSHSYDRGKTWSTGEDSKLGGPCSRFFIRRLKSGRILLINHINFEGRNNLTALLSEDDGKTFPYSLLLDERNSVSYPDAVECENGYIYITYDRERGCFKHSLTEAYADAREVLTAKISEQDILNGKLVSKEGFLKNVICKLNKLAPELPDPYEENILDIEAFVERVIDECENPLDKVFEKYPLSCINIKFLNSAKLDELVERFYKSECKDKSILLKIIELIRSTPTAKPNPHPIIERITEYIKNNLNDELSVNDIAKKMNISVYYLSHLFKQITGISILEYRNELRLTKAKQMLIESRFSVNEIAIKCGFCNASYFAEVFSRSEKISPSQFRKLHSDH
ncbi:MAG: exo-alpha-sialidase [Clostridia bacterium]|nr:exo-alpha-sialidase [Clostridia bacterium]